VSTLQRSVAGSHTDTVTSTVLRTPPSSSTVSRAPAPSASTSRVTTSTTLNRRGARGSAGLGGRGSGLGGTKNGSFVGAGFLCTLSSGTISAPVPFVSVSSTQILPISTYHRLA
jgi:hypothetical protein